MKVRSKPVTATDSDPATETRASLVPADVKPAAGQDVAWATAVAGFAELLRKSPYARMAELEAIQGIVDAQAARDADRREFGQLLVQARTMLAAP